MKDNKITLQMSDINSMVSKVCREIMISGWRPEYVVGLTRGGLVPAVMISHYFEVPCETLKPKSESNTWMAEDAYNGKKILIVDDITNYGSTINWIMEDWRSSCFPNSEKWEDVWGKNVRFANLYDNLASKSNVKVSYTADEIDRTVDPRWIIFPWEQWW